MWGILVNHQIWKLLQTAVTFQWKHQSGLHTQDWIWDQFDLLMLRYLRVLITARGYGAQGTNVTVSIIVSVSRGWQRWLMGRQMGNMVIVLISGTMIMIIVNHWWPTEWRQILGAAWEKWIEGQSRSWEEVWAMWQLERNWKGGCFLLSSSLVQSQPAPQIMREKLAKSSRLALALEFSKVGSLWRQKTQVWHYREKNTVNNCSFCILFLASNPLFTKEHLFVCDNDTALIRISCWNISQNWEKRRWKQSSNGADHTSPGYH